jgi:UDP-N-acetylglucosamine 4,6-dehydratase/5-epimerase
MFLNKKVLITGGTGMLGQELTRQLLKKGVDEIRIFSRNESVQHKMQQTFSDERLKFIVGDIKDANFIKECCWGIDYVFHTASLKYTDKCENQPREAVAININGTQNVINACLSQNVDICVNISSTKANDANCFYGKTKAVAEGLITEANNQGMHTDFISVRIGNLMGSGGTAIDKWSQFMKNNKKTGLIKVSRLKRFFIPVQDAVKSAFKAMELQDRGEIFVPRMPAFFLDDIAKELKRRFGCADMPIQYVDIPQGERRIEWLIKPEEAYRTIKTKDFFIIYPAIDIIGSLYPKIKKDRTIINGYCMNDANTNTDRELLEKYLKKASY